MNATRILVTGAGLAIVVAGTYLLYFEAALDRYFSLGELTAGVLVVVGLVIITVASQARRGQAPSTTIVDRQETVHDHPAEAAPIIVQTREPQPMLIERGTQTELAPAPAGGAKPSTAPSGPYMATAPTGSPPRRLAKDAVGKTETKGSQVLYTDDR